MAWTKFQIILAAILVVTGSINTLSTKWADKLSSIGSDGKKREFDHPFVQACFMFFGEFLCLVAFKLIYFVLSRRRDGSEDDHSLTIGSRNFNPFILLPAALCDMVATSIMYVGLNLTYASSFQMLRGSVIIFVGFLSVAFLDRRFVARQWLGISLIIAGLAVVGASDFLAGDAGAEYTRNNVITGDLLIILAQIITSVQMVYEERFVGRLNIPALQAVGWEGFFGFTILGFLLVPMYFIHTPAPFNHNAHGVLEDLPDALAQIAHNPLLVVAILGTIFSIAFFNFAGISVTKEMSATTRMVLDSVRTLVIWAVSLGIRWQKFYPLQILGFAGLLIGMCLYNNVIVPQLWAKLCSLRRRPAPSDDFTEPIISNQAADDTGVTA